MCQDGSYNSGTHTYIDYKGYCEELMNREMEKIHAQVRNKRGLVLLTLWGEAILQVCGHAQNPQVFQMCSFGYFCGDFLTWA